MSNKPPGPIVGKGRIKVGTPICQGQHCGNWPQCIPPKSEYCESDTYHLVSKTPDMIFDVEWNGLNWVCSSDGYNYDSKDSYGSILIYKVDGVELLT